MSLVVQHAPRFDKDDAVRIARDLFGLETSAKPLPSERDQNFCLTASGGGRYVLKIANAAEPIEILALQNQAMRHVFQKSRLKNPQANPCPEVLTNLEGEHITTLECPQGNSHFVRLLTYIPGKPLALVKPHDEDLLSSLGRFFGHIDRHLKDFDHPAAHRDFHWDLKNASKVIGAYIGLIPDPQKREQVGDFLLRFQRQAEPLLAALPAGIIHNDGNDYNVLVQQEENRRPQVTGVIDFGDMVHTYSVCETAIICAYAMLNKKDPLTAAKTVVGGYHQVHPLDDRELTVLFDLMCMRLCMSVCLSAHQFQTEPDNEYLRISENPAWVLLGRLAEVDPGSAHSIFRKACGKPANSEHSAQPRDLSRTEILSLRRQAFGRNLSLAYEHPLKIVRGRGQYLFDETGKRYLDGVNNVCHVGHCHPHVVTAGIRQMQLLNTNTRYLHDHIVTYAQRLLSKFPDPLRVCFFTCTGSEANELALRLARNYTGRQDIITLDGAYHGNTQALIDISPYKHDGPGGRGAPAWVHKVLMPDGYRGPHKGVGIDTGTRYAQYVQQAVDAIRVEGGGVAAIICESLLGCGGQIVLPENYLKAAFKAVRSAAGVCIVDEVQVGFGRVGSHFWAFETQDVVPDIVTLGKPMGNGHPLAAVITTPEIADAFANGMEYFNTFGGNPVSCAIGMAVLDVIESENLQSNALKAGRRLLSGLKDLMPKHPLIGDTRGLGLFVGVELVLDHKTLEPAPEQAAYIINRLKEYGILTSTDGPLHNVLKLKPPIVFTEQNAEEVAEALDRVLGEEALHAQIERNPT